MNANVVTALAALLGSVAGASAAIATTWISQRSQTRRELAKSEMRKREMLYGEFITEAARLLSAEPHGRRAHRRYSKRRNGVSEEIQRRLPCRVRQIFPILKNRRLKINEIVT